MSLVVRYTFDQSSDILAEYTGNSSLALSGTTTSLTSVTDATYGTVVSFNGGYAPLPAPKPPSSMEGDNPRTISVWTRRDDFTDFSWVFANSGTAKFWGKINNNSDEFEVSVSDTTITASSPSAYSVNTWAHTAVTFDGTTVSIYVNGVFNTSQAITTPLDPAGTGWFGIGGKFNTLNLFFGRMSDFRFYDDALDANAVSTLFSYGPNPIIPDLALAAYTHLIDINWLEVAGASTYYLKHIRDSGVEQDLTTTTSLTYTSTNLTPGSSYEIRVYTNLDQINHIYSETIVTSALDSTSVGNLMTRLGNDITLLTSDAVGQIDSLLGTVLTTGDIVKTSVGNTTFVKNTETITLPKVTKETILTSFDQSAGSGQTVSVVLPDASTSVFSYDEASNEVIFNGTDYAIGSSFVSGGFKVTPKDI